MVKIYINPGHGGKDSGAIGHGMKEKDLTLKIAKKLAKKLESTNAVVKLSRTDDRFIGLTETANDANKWGADIFISIHINAFTSTANGYEDFIFTNASKKSEQYRDILHSEIIKQISPVTNRGKKRQNFAVLRQTKMPAILTETLFITNPADATRLKSDDFLEKAATGHFNGLVKIFNLSVKNVNKPAPAKPQPASTGYKGKRLESITNGTLNFYNKPSWDKKDVFGTLTKGQGFPEVISKHKVGTAHQYKVKNSKGKVFYITASPVYVKLV